MKSDQASASFWKFQLRAFGTLFVALALVIGIGFAVSHMQGDKSYGEDVPMDKMEAGNDMVWVKMADGFDFPVGKPDSNGYYKSRGFRPNGHLGDDWNGTGGGNSDLGAPVYSMGHGIVVFARDARMGWGNVVIVRHVYQSPEGGIRAVDSLYGHLDEVMVREKQAVRKGDQVGTIGTNRGQYWAHLHFEVRKNIKIGMRRSSFPRDFSCYYDPTAFIQRHRKLKVPKSKYKVAFNTYEDGRKFFAPYSGSSGNAASTSKPKESDDEDSPAASNDSKASKRKSGTFFQRSDDYFY
jgi:hypothetical protein